MLHPTLHILHSRRGFTLVELLVAVAVFSVAVSTAAGGFINALKTQHQTTALVSANSNVSLVIEQMAREIRTGSDFCVNGQNCSLDSLSFKNARGEIVTYCLFDSSIFRGTGGAVCGGGNFQKITADNVFVRHLNFYLIGENPGDGLQPRTTISVGVSSKEVGISESVINLQTTISPRFPLDS